MNSPLLFIPLGIYVLGALAGLVCMAVALVGVKKSRAAQPHQPAPALQPPMLSDTPQHAGTAARGLTLFFKALLVLGLVSLVLGVLGVWSARVSVGYEKNPASEWSDGRAPELEPLIRMHCAPS